jgi:hypothetical protein
MTFSDDLTITPEYIISAAYKFFENELTEVDIIFF